MKVGRPSREVTFGMAVLAITLVGSALRIPQMGDSIVWDELSTQFVVSGVTFSEMFNRVAGEQEITPPLYFVFSWLSAKLGDANFFLRLPSLISGVLLIPATYWLGLRTVGRSAGIVGAAIIALGPFFIYFSTEARAYSLLALLTLLSTLALMNAIERNQVRWYVGFSLLCAAAMYTHYTAVFILLAQVLWALIYFRDLRLRILASVVAAFVLYIPWISQYLADSASPGSRTIENFRPFGLAVLGQDLQHWLLETPVTNSKVLTSSLTYLVLAAGIAIAITGLCLRRSDRLRVSRMRPSKELVLVGMLGLLPVALAAVASALIVTVFQPKTLAVSWPAVALLLGYLATSVKAQIPRIASITLILGFFAIQGIQTFKAENLRPDYDSVAAFISDTASRDDDIVMFAPFTLAAPTNGLDVALDAKRSEAAWLGFPTRLGASSREDETAAVLPDGVGRYAPLPVESEADLFRRVEPSRTGNRTYLVVQKEDLAAFEKLTDSTPVSQMIDYMKAAPSERIFLPGLVGGVDVYVFYPPRSRR